jgi:phosphoenolpyruvate---glycerone phosphotransferase subunit DhaL
VSRLAAALQTTADAVLASADDLNALDAKAGDGDLGVTMSTAARVVIALLPEADGQPAADVLRTCGAAIAREAPSTCGTLVATGLLRASKAVGGDAADAGTVARALEAAREGIATRGNAEPGSKTMLDALAPAAEAAADSAGRGLDVHAALHAAAAAADDGAKATVSMVPRHGRAGWLADRSAGHEDAGARLVAILLSAAARSLDDEVAPNAAS